ncbi:MAG: signal peptide peptidase SppA [Opitutaceae bacterium]
MKDFFKMLAACFIAFGMWMVAGGVFLVLLVGVLVSVGEHEPAIPKGAMLVLDLSVNVTDMPQSSDDLAMLRDAVVGDKPPSIHLRGLLSALEAASKDDRIKGLYIHGSFLPSGMGSGFAALKEVRAAIVRFKESGKPVLAYLRFPDTRDFYIASAADSISLNPMGDIITPGLAIERFYLADFFERYGIGVQVPHAGRYKSYGESYVRSDMSEEDRLQNRALLNGLWSEYLNTVSLSRGISAAKLQSVIDEHAKISPEIALSIGLVDQVEHFGNVLARLREATGVADPSESFKQVDLSAYVHAVGWAAAPLESRDKVAILYVEGTIVGGEGRADQAGSDRLARELRKMTSDDTAKAIVLRVNSPGGAAIAADIIADEVARALAVKPVVVSMGSYAASGGYWISSRSSRIFAESNTLTGSIGVVGMIPNIERLANDHGIFFDGVKTARHADMFTLSRPKTDEEMAILQSGVDDAYSKFIRLVADGRGMEEARVREVAEGRVWTGQDALEVGLVDEIGGLEDAIRHAAELAGLTDYAVEDYPAPRSRLEEILKRLGGGGAPLASRFEGRLSQWVRGRIEDLEMLDSLSDPRGVYALSPIVRIEE